MKRVLLMSILLLLVSFAMADVYTIGTGTTAASTSPFYGLYDYSWSKVIYTQAEINAAGLTNGANILGIGFFVGNTPNNYSMNDQRVYARHTTQTMYDTADINYPGSTNFTQYFQGDLVYNGGGWYYYTFSTPFAWNGNQNIEFLFENWDGNYITGYPTFQYTSTTPNYLTVYKGQDNSFPDAATGLRSYSRPNIQLFTPQTTPPNPAQVVFPTNGGIQISPSVTLRWAPVNGFPDGYRISLGTNNPPTNILNNVDIQTATSYTPATPLAFNTTHYWKVVPYNSFGDAANCPVWSFTTHGDGTVTQLPYIQGFDQVSVPDIPFDWDSYVDGTGAVVASYATSPNSAPNSIRLYNGSVVTNEAVLISPQLAQSIPTNTVRMKVWVKSGGANYNLDFGVMTDPNNISTYTSVQTISMPTTTWQEYIIPFNGYTGTGRYLAIRHGQGATARTIYVDDVTIELIAANDLACTTLAGNVTPSVNSPTTYTASIFNWGTNPQSTYTVKLINTQTNQELATANGITCAPGATVQIPLTWTPTVEGPMTICGKVILAGDQNTTNDQSPIVNISVMPAGLIQITIGDGSATMRMPIDFFYKNSINQTMYYPNEIGMFGNITAITLYNQFISTTLQDKPIKIWMTGVTDMDLSGGWIPASQMTLVYDGTVSFPSGENSIVIPLQIPFAYTGGNLVVMFNRPMDTGYFSSSDLFKGQTIGSTRARNIYSDTVVYDPEAPGAAGTLTGQFPKTGFSMTPISPDPYFSITPASPNYGTVVLDTTRDQTFTIVNAGGGTLNVNTISIAGSPYFILQNLPTLPVSLVTGQSVTFIGRYAPTAAGTHTATITVTDNMPNRATHTVTLTGTCIDTNITALPYFENFDEVTVPNLPVTWTSLVSGGTSPAVVSIASAPHTAPNCVRVYNGSPAATFAMLIAPPLATSIPVNTTRAKIWVKGVGATYNLSVGVMTDPLDGSTYTEIQSFATPTVWTEFIIPLNSYTGTGRFVAIKHGNGAAGQTIYVDSFTLELIAANDLACTAIVGNTTPSVNNATTYTASIFNWGTNSQSTYTVKLINAQNQELATANGVTCAPGATVQVPITWTPTQEGPVTLYGKIVLAGDQNSANDQSPPLNISVMPAGLNVVTIGDGSQTIRMPLDFFYKNSLNQSLYFPDELGAPGNITAIMLYNQFTSTTLQDKPVKIWMGSTTLNDLSGGWVPASQMTLVYDSTVTFPSGENNILIPLQTTFAYTGGNLIVMFKRPTDTAYFSSTDYFKGQTIGTTRARNVFSDTVDYNPEAPEAAGTLTGQFPKTSFYLTPLSDDPFFSMIPASHNYGTVLLDTTRDQTFRITNAGGGTLMVNSITLSGSPMYSLQNLPTLPAALSTGQYFTFTARYAPTAAGQHAATITVNHSMNGGTTVTGELTGTCIDTTIHSLPYTQNFDAVTVPNLPPDWAALITPGGTSPAVVTIASAPQSAPNCVRIYNGSPVAPNTMLIAPPLATTIPVNTTRAKIWVKGVAATYSLSVGVLTDPLDPTTYTEIQSFTTPTAWTEFIIPLNGYTGTGRFVAIKHGNTATGQTIYVDDFSLELIAADDLGCSALSGNSTPSVNTATTYTATVFNWGTNAQSAYTVKLVNSAGTELASAPGVPVTPGQSVQVSITWTPTAQGPVTLYGKVVLPSDPNTANDQSPPLNITVMPEGVNVITIGDGSANIRMPLDFFYKSSLNQTIYNFNELNTFGSITAITLYNQFTTATLQNKPIKVWIGSTALDNLSAGWIPASQMTLVYDGTINFPAGANNIVIPLQVPFMYTSGNLVVMFKRPLDTAYFNTADYFKGQTVGTNRARNVYSDSVDYNPETPEAVGTLTGQFAKTSFSIISDGMASMNGTVTSGGNPVPGVNITVNGTAFSQLTAADGTYNFPFLLPGQYTVTAYKVAYETQTVPVTLVADETTTLNFNLVLSQVVNVTGHLVGSDAPTVPLVGAEVTLVGPLTHTGTSDAQGNFTVTGVLSGNAYNYIISMVGYANLTGTINVGSTNYDMGNLVMNEEALPPRNVTAAVNPQGQILLTWMPPGSGGGGGPQEDFEITDGGWEASANWGNNIGDWEWTNEYDVTDFVDTYGSATVIPPPTAHSGTGMWGTKINTNYNNSGGYNYLTKSFNFTGITNPQLVFWSWENVFGDFDYCQVAVNGTLVWGPSWDYTNTQWRERTINLSQFGGQANVQIQFQMFATTVVNYAGWYIDDVYVGPALNNQPTSPAPVISFNIRGLGELEAASLAENLSQASPRTSVSDSFSSAQANRALTGYKVWRFTAGNEQNETSWISLTTNTITDTTIVDTAWNTLPDGIYKWAVKGIYSNNLQGPAGFSNPMQILRNDLSALSITGNTTPTVGVPSNYTVRIKNTGTDPKQGTDYTVKIMYGTSELTSVPGVNLAPGVTHDLVVPWTPSGAGPMSIYGKVVLPTDSIPGNDSTPPLNLLVQGPGTFAFTVGAGDQTARIPIDMYYKSSLHQYLIYPADLENNIGMLTGLGLYNNFTQDLSDKPIKIWISTTTLNDLSAGWLPTTNHTLVYDGLLDFPIGENTIIIPFNSPYLYLDSNNIVITFKRPLDTAYFNTTNYFKAQTGTQAARSRNVYSDSIDYDPEAPQAVGTASAQFAKTTVFMIPGGVGHLNGTVTGAGNQPLEGATVQFVNGGYYATTNAAGQYNIQNILPNTYQVNYSSYGYVTQTQTVTIEEDETETMNVTLQPMPTVNVTGTILASDTAAGISGAFIHLMGYANYQGTTNASGAFTIPSVYANQTYEYVISAPGYTSQNGSINVGSTNHSMGNITLSEVAYAPIGVTAQTSTDQASVNISWLAPDPNALEITESFEANTFPPDDWTTIVTNQGSANTQGVYPTWCRVSTVNVSGTNATPTQGNYQTGLFWDYNHQDEWLITPSFSCPPAAYLTFDSYVFLGSVNNDHYYVKLTNDNGNNWTVLWDASTQTGGWNYYDTPIAIDLTPYAGQQVKLAFNAVDGPTADGLWYVWFIDNIYIGNTITRISFGSDQLTSKSGAASSVEREANSWTVGVASDRAFSRAMEMGGSRTEPTLLSTREIRNTTKSNRVLVGYKVWRLSAGQEANEASWHLITPETTTELEAYDPGWATLPNGQFRWAVKAVYTNGVLSVPAFSNVLQKTAQNGMIVGVVRRASNNSPIMGATVTASGITATTNAAGAYTLIVPIGTHSVTASFTGFVTQTVEGVVVGLNQTATVNFLLVANSENDDDLIPVTATAYHGNFPNPFNPETTIHYSIKDAGQVLIEVYNLKGQLVRTLVNQEQTRGHHRIVFDSRDNSGKPISSGVYLIRMKAPGFETTSRMLLMK